jgi:hypothetical protein
MFISIAFFLVIVVNFGAVNAGCSAPTNVASSGQQGTLVLDGTECTAAAGQAPGL